MPQQISSAAVRQKRLSLTGQQGERQKEITSLQIALSSVTKSSERRDLLEKLWHAQEFLNSVPMPRNAFQEQALHNSSVGLEKIRGQLAEDELLLEYVLQEPVSHCLVISKEGTHGVRLAGREKIESLIDSYLEELKARKPGLETGKRLYSILLGPIAECKRKKRLIVVPDGKLHLIPLDTLRDAKGQYLLESHVVTTVPSATVLSLLRSAPPREEGIEFLGVGDVPYGNQALEMRASVNHAVGTDATRQVTDLDLRHLRPLQTSREEVTTAAEVLGKRSQLLLGTEASEAAVKGQRLPAYDVLHFAVHAVADTTYPDRAALVLAGDPLDQEDGLLQEREITLLPLNADLVVLSACDTAVGRLQEQEGIANLARAFLFAGARAVVASLWPADDRITSQLMRQFYIELAAGKDKATALQQAKLSIIQKFGPRAMPYFWASFTLIGEGSKPVVNFQSSSLRQ